MLPPVKIARVESEQPPPISHLDDVKLPVSVASPVEAKVKKSIILAWPGAPPATNPRVLDAAVEYVYPLPFISPKSVAFPSVGMVM